MATPPWVALAVALLSGAAGGLWGTKWGLRQLGSPGQESFRHGVATATAGALGGIAATTAAWHAGGWWPAPGLWVWATVLTAAGYCDALTQRVPTPLVRQATALTALLLFAAAVGAGHWIRLLMAGVVAASAGALFLLGARFAGIGRGDVRLAVLGGLGLGWAGLAGIGLGLAVLLLITFAQALVALARGGNRGTHISYGPAMVVGFLLAAASAHALS